jgi:Ca2+-binding EF-hand superfamily protein
MKNIVKIVSIFLGLVWLLSTNINAQQFPNRGPMSFSMYDLNGDGFITAQEFNDVRAKRMQEKANAGMPMRNAGNAPSFESFDTNGDGKITELELLKGQNSQMMKNKGNKGFKGNQKGMMQ